MLVTFHNVILTIEAESAEEAYDYLCDLVYQAQDDDTPMMAELVTDTYDTQAEGETEPTAERSTQELWPDNRRSIADDIAGVTTP